MGWPLRGASVVNRKTLARLRIMPSWGCAPLPTASLRLVQEGGECRIETTVQTGRRRKYWRVVVSPSDVDEQLALLRDSRIPAYPVSPMVCDGEYVELAIPGEFANLTVGWWTEPPQGAETLAAFSEWLRRLGLPNGVGQEHD